MGIGYERRTWPVRAIWIQGHGISGAKNGKKELANSILIVSTRLSLHCMKGKRIVAGRVRFLIPDHGTLEEIPILNLEYYYA
jgi:hypothetical protein